jgi:hypothetical protein
MSTNNPLGAWWPRGCGCARGANCGCHDIQNPGISAIHWNAGHLPVELVTRMIEAKRTTLVSLDLFFSCCNRNYGQPREQRPVVASMEYAARATARLTRLESITLRVPQHVGLLLSLLVGHAIFCHLHIVFEYNSCVCLCYVVRQTCTWCPRYSSA